MNRDVRKPVCLALAILLLSFAGVIVRAQSGRKPQGRPSGEKPIVKLETREVVLPLIAYDAGGNYVDDLTPKDVLVLEEGESRPVASLRREAANIVLILDLSNEIGTFKNGPTQRLEREERPIWERGKDYQVVARPTAREFAEKFVSGLSPRDQIAVIQYADKVQLVQDWTSDREQVLKSLSSRYRVGVKASFFDALKLAADKLQTRQGGRRVIVLVSDGLDSNSQTGRAQAMAALTKSRASVFVVGWAEALRLEIELAANWMSAHERQGSATYERLAELRRQLPRLDLAAFELRSLAESTGGEIWFPADHQELIALYRRVSREIGAQYSLAFVTETRPSLEDNRPIQVLPARTGLTVRSRRSYYAGDEPKSPAR